jgi:hypothetical protein
VSAYRLSASPIMRSAVRPDGRLKCELILEGEPSDELGVYPPAPTNHEQRVELERLACWKHSRGQDRSDAVSVTIETVLGSVRRRRLVKKAGVWVQPNGDWKGSREKINYRPKKTWQGSRPSLPCHMCGHDRVIGLNRVVVCSNCLSSQQANAK